MYRMNTQTLHSNESQITMSSNLKLTANCDVVQGALTLEPGEFTLKALAERAASYALMELRWLKDSFL